MKIKVFSFAVSNGSGQLHPEHEAQINRFLEEKGCSINGNTKILTTSCTGVNRMHEVFVNVTITVIY